MKRLANKIDALTEKIGSGVAWLTSAMVLVVMYDVCVRYAFNSTNPAMVELEWHLFAFLFLLAAGYTLKHDRHVRVDVFYSRMSKKHQGLINFLGTLLFTIPFSVVAIMTSWTFVANSFAVSETSPDPGGLPMRYLIKAAIPVGFALIILQSISLLIRSWQDWQEQQEVA
ncbi:MAG: TRAP transporter small permease subunit [Calditrichia bacterium]